MFKRKFNFNNIYDTELMFTNYTDLDNQSKLYGIEFSSRFGDRFKIIAEMLVLSDADELDTFYEIRQDDYVELGINVYF